ncbi:myo-inositol-1(or 4)-monophosphatase [Candidatus Kinetoplastibacterium oncopeltii TCC290E]|uniref:Inositol-1-monophosphatase n=1 Tax=Candidatus Kinetoplastidibacterium stringomonadis TCC290E TaxID=1208920 RepID=M1LVR8_9PROT|nr:inositol monophosphatase family protein [Candidatus Kinetoplastibacterium oncopeltii]AGF48176.1 myo-inositol-1(or 4)-monophosphatase [Candidatus Kinetoplastibacterium oncopeltii TCC290E]
MLNIAVKAVRRSSIVLSRFSLDLERVNISRHLINEYADEACRLAEETAKRVILTAYPDHAISLDGNFGDLKNHKGFLWVICPIDGLINFAYGFPFYAISISLIQNGNILQSVVYDPVRNDLFTSRRGSGTFLNDRRIRVSGQISFSNSLIGDGSDHIDINDAPFNNKIITGCLSTRRIGSVALGLAYVACGRLDGFYGCSSLDRKYLAAGSLMVSEAGGLVTDFNGDQDWLQSRQIIAATPKIFTLFKNYINKILVK